MARAAAVRTFCALLEGDLDAAEREQASAVAFDLENPGTSYLSGRYGLSVLMAVRAGRAGWSHLEALAGISAVEMRWNAQFIGLARAVLHGRDGDRTAAAAEAGAAVEASAIFPMAGHVGRWMVAGPAHADGWGEPEACTTVVPGRRPPRRPTAGRRPSPRGLRRRRPSPDPAAANSGHRSRVPGTCPGGWFGSVAADGPWPVEGSEDMSPWTVSRASGWVRAGEAGPAWSPRHRVAMASALVVAGALQTLEDVVEPTYDDPAARFAAMARDATPFEVSKIFGITALPFLVVTAIVLWALARGRMPRLAFTAGTMVFAGFIGLAVLQGVETAEIAALKGGLGVADVQHIDDVVTGSVAAIPVVVMFLSLLIGLVLITVALWRARTVPRIALLLIIAFLAADFGVAGVLPFPAHLIWLAALAWIAWSILVAGPRPTDEAQTDR